MISHILEITEFLDKQLLYDIHIEETEYEILDRIIKSNKWLRFEDWLQIYDKLRKILSVCSTCELKEISNERFQIANNIEVEVQKMQLENYYRKIFSLEKNDLAPQYLKIQVRNIQFSKMKERIRDLEERLQENTTIVEMKEHHAKVDKDSNESVKIEYVPLGIETACQPYTPYKPSKFEDDLERDKGEPYSPKPVNSSGESFQFDTTDDLNEKYSPIVTSPEEAVSTNVPPYKASTILKQGEVRLKNNSELKHLNNRDATERIHHTRTRHMIKLFEGHDLPENKPKRKRTSPVNKKSQFNKQLFGSDESDKDEHVNKQDRSNIKDKLRKTKGNTKYHVDEEPTCKKSKSSDLNQAPKSIKTEFDKKKPILASTKETIKENGKSSDKSKKSKSKSTHSSTSTQIKISEEERERNKEKHEKDIEIYQQLTKTIKALKKPTQNVDIIKLNHLTPNQLISTFAHFKPILDKHFIEFKNRKYHLVKVSEDIHLLIMNIINSENIRALVNHLKNHYEDDIHSLPRFTDLYMNLMMPEWVLAIFMKEYNLSRTAAIQQIHRQDEADLNENLNLYFK